MTTSGDHKSSRMRLTVDRDRCEGHNICLGYIPELLDVDDRGIVSVQRGGDLPDELLDEAGFAVDCCPERALSLRTSR